MESKDAREVKSYAEDSADDLDGNQDKRRNVILNTNLFIFLRPTFKMGKIFITTHIFLGKIIKKTYFFSVKIFKKNPEAMGKNTNPHHGAPRESNTVNHTYCQHMKSRVHV